jgi:GntR family transcriptional regulator
MKPATSIAPPPLPLPIYMQLTELLARDIAAGRWAHGDRLPPEAELAQRLGVAVGTLRKALAELQARGLLRRRQGSGTYVELGEAPRGVYGFLRLEKADGTAGLPGAQVLALDRDAPPQPWPREHAQARLPAQCWRIRRLRLLDREPVAIEEIWFDAARRPSLEAGELSESLYYFYREQLGLWITHVDDRLAQATVPDWAPAGFGLAAGSPALCVQRLAMAAEDRVEEVSLTWIDSRRAHYVARWR